MTNISRNLKRFRLSQKLSVEQAAYALGISSQAVAYWEQGTTLPDISLLPRIAKLYSITIDELYREQAANHDNHVQHLSDIYEATRDPEDFLRADEAYRDLIAAGEHTAEDLRLYGIMQQYMADYCMEQALNLFQQSMELCADTDPETYSLAKRQMMYLLIQIGKEPGILREYLNEICKKGTDLDEWLGIIAAYQYVGRNESAWHWFQKAVEWYPDDPMLNFYGGSICEARGNFEAAIAYWEKTLTLDPEFTDAVYAMGECLERMGEFQKAYGLWSRLVAELEKRELGRAVEYPRKRAEECRKRI